MPWYFFYGKVLDKPLDEMEAFIRAKKPRKLPVVLKRNEVMLLLDQLDGIHKLLASLLYGTGMRLLETMRLRVQDIDFEYSRIYVHQAKGKKDRYVPLPATLVDNLQKQIVLVRQLHEKDLSAGHGEVVLPDALHRKIP